MVDGGDKSMTTQKQIKEWIPTAVEIFQRFMPCPEIPEIHIVNAEIRTISLPLLRKSMELMR